MHEPEPWTVRPTGEALSPGPVRVLDGDSFTLAPAAEVRTPRFLAAATAGARAKRGTGPRRAG